MPHPYTRKASPKKVADALKLDASWWIEPTNKFSNFSTLAKHLKGRYPNLHNSGKILTDEVLLAEYLGSSSILHLLSSGEYLSLSIRSLLCGNFSQSKHLSYYSELRSAMSLLSRHGIGIVNGHNLMLLGTGKAKMWKKLEAPYTHTERKPKQWGTHIACWSALKRWSSTPNATTFFSTNISYAGKTLDDYISQTPISVAPILGDWLKSWSLDLKKFEKDRDTRNNASYNPDFDCSSDYTHTTYKELLETISLCWRIVTSNQLDIYLIYDAIVSSIKNSSSRITLADAHSQANTILSNEGISSALLNLLAQSNNDWDKFKKIISPSSASPSHSQMLCRALILHLLALKSINNLVHDAGHKNNYISALSNYLKTNLNEDISIIHDRYADIGDALDDIHGEDSHPLGVIENFEMFKTLSSMHYPNAWMFLPIT